MVHNSFHIELDKTSGITLQQQLINAIKKAVSEKDLEPGEILPSINYLSHNLSIARDTVFKAYQELKRLRIVDSTPSKGYMVSQQLKKILLLLDFFSPFKESFHASFKKNIPQDLIVDLVFHHYNREIFDSIVTEGIGKYDIFVIMNYDTSIFKINSVLKKLDPSKLLLIDIPIKDWNNFKPENYACISQNFDLAVYDCLTEIKDRILNYNKFAVIYTKKLNHPEITLAYTQKFCSDNSIDYSVHKETDSLILEAETLYFILRQSDLARILQLCRKQQFIPGKNIGILSYNDSPLYEYIGKGISVISTDFHEMGFKAAKFVKDRELINETIPTKVILRGSL